MSLLQGDMLTQISFSVFENKGVFAVLLGPGVSRSAEVPTVWEITLDLVRRAAMARGVAEQADWDKWYTQATGKAPNYFDLLAAVAPSPSARRATLRSYIEPTELERAQCKKVPTPAHHALADLVRTGFIRVIVTTNVDCLMESALREQGIEPTVVASEDSLQGAEPLPHSACYIVKLYGDQHHTPNHSHATASAPYPAVFDALLDRVLDEYGLIVCGWSGEWDPALHAALLRAPNRRYPVYWALRGAATPGAQALIRHRQAKHIDIDTADLFFPQLQQSVETLVQSHRPNPWTMDLLIGNTKRFISKAEYRIQLDDLICQESDRLLGQLWAVGLTAYDVSPEALRAVEQLTTYESLTEPLARMVSVLGRWGEGDDVATVTALLCGLNQDATAHANAPGTSGTSSTSLGLRAYPAILLFTAYGLGLVRAQRWQDLHAFFMTALPRGEREPQRMVQSLFLSAWKEAEHAAWHNMPGVVRKVSAFSDHLYDVMCQWKSSFVGVASNFELLFERFELLASLAYFESYEERYLEDRVRAKSTTPLARMPVGRLGWHAESLKALVAELEASPQATALLAAGFAKGSPRFLALFIDNLRRYQSRMQWLA